MRGGAFFVSRENAHWGRGDIVEGVQFTELRTEPKTDPKKSSIQPRTDNIKFLIIFINKNVNVMYVG